MPEQNLQRCSSCKEEKPYSEFYKANTRSIGIQGCCKQCSSIYRKQYYVENKEREYAHARKWVANNPTKVRDILLSKYGITQADYDTLRSKQGYSCAICHVHEDFAPKSNKNSSSKTALHLDHNHVTGYIRGLLCFNCNAMLGKAKDNTKILQNAIEYLKQEKQLKKNANK